MPVNPFALTDEDMTRLGMHRFDGEQSPSSARFMGQPIHECEIAGRAYVYTEVEDRLFLGEGPTRRDAFLAMARHTGVPMERRLIANPTEPDPALLGVWRAFEREVTGTNGPTTWRPWARPDPLADA
jgi:hypothetical protein